MSKIKIGVQVTAKVCHTNVTVSGTFQGYRLEDQEDPTSICGTVLHVNDGMQHLDYVYVDSIKVFESEDERIRKELIFFLKEEIPQCSIKEHADKLKEFVSYLEKQKDKVVEFDHDREQQPAKEDGPFDEDKFLEGELAAFLQNYDKEYDDDAAISDVAIHFYELGKKMKQKPAEWSEEDERMVEIAEECATNKDFVFETLEKQLSFLDWLKSLPERFNIKPKQEWSEEDEAAYNAFICEVINEKMNPTIEQIKWLRSICDRLKSLRPQPHWKPSDEQLRPLEYAIDYFKKKGNDTTYLESLLNDLNEL